MRFQNREVKSHKIKAFIDYKVAKRTPKKSPYFAKEKNVLVHQTDSSESPAQSKAKPREKIIGNCIHILIVKKR